MRVTFFCFAKRKSPKKRRPPVCDPFAERRGKPAECRLRGAPQNSLRAGALRSNNCGESVHEAWALRRPCHPTTAPPQAQPAGVGQPNIQTTEQPTSIRAIAALGPVWAARGACAREVGPSEAKARVDVWFSSPLWMRRGAQGLADQGSRVSERRAAARVERDPAKPEHRRLPRSEAQGTQTVGSPFLWFLSFGDAKERDSHAGRLPASALSDGMPFDEHAPPRLRVQKRRIKPSTSAGKLPPGSAGRCYKNDSCQGMKK